MYFAWALEHREVKLHQARINYLSKSIREIEGALFRNSNDVYYGKSTGERIAFLQDFIDNNKNSESEVTGHKDLLDLLSFHQHQQQQLEAHERARRVWGLCAVFMTAVAIVSVAVVALGLSAFTGGIIVAVASCVTVFGSALYRLKPEFFDNTAITIKNKFCFFKSQPAPTIDPVQNAMHPAPAFAR